MDPLLQHGYATISPIANGAFSQVVRAKHLGTQIEVAVKTFSRELLAKEGKLGRDHSLLTTPGLVPKTAKVRKLPE